MNKLLTTLIFAATATFAMQGFAADAAPVNGARQTVTASSMGVAKKKAHAHTVKKIHKAAAGKTETPAR